MAWRSEIFNSAQQEIPSSIRARNQPANAATACAERRGYANSLTVSDSTIYNFGNVGSHESGFRFTSPTQDNLGIITGGFTMANGVMTVPTTFFANDWLERMCITGGNFFWWDINVGQFAKVRILDVTQPGGYGTSLRVYTDWPGGFPSRTYAASGLQMVTHPAPICTFTNVTGCPEVVDLSRALAGVPLYSYSKRFYTSTDNTIWQLWGKIKKIVVAVTSAYTEGTATATLPFLFVKVSDRSDTTYSRTINLKVLGTRTLDVSGGYPAAWTGVQSGDTLPDLTEALWSCGNYNPGMTAALTTGAFNVEIITDQGDLFPDETPAPILLGQACL
jgi:hypothetical protein